MNYSRIRLKRMWWTIHIRRTTLNRTFNYFIHSEFLLKTVFLEFWCNNKIKNVLDKNGSNKSIVHFNVAYPMSVFCALVSSWFFPSADRRTTDKSISIEKHTCFQYKSQFIIKLHPRSTAYLEFPPWLETLVLSLGTLDCPRQCRSREGCGAISSENHCPTAVALSARRVNRFGIRPNDERDMNVINEFFKTIVFRLCVCKPFPLPHRWLPSPDVGGSSWWIQRWTPLWRTAGWKSV